MILLMDSGNSLLITGRTNAGKTLFLLNYAEYMGYKNIKINFKTDSRENIKEKSISYFRDTIVSSSPYTTKSLQIANINLSNKNNVFIDSPAISSSISYEQSVRNGMAQTLSLIRENNLILHIIDASCILNYKDIDDVDMAMYKLGKKRGNYIVLANKADIKGSIMGVNVLSENLVGVKIIKISALNKTGFNNVRKILKNRGPFLNFNLGKIPRYRFPS
mgnify:CR=1 FL=1